MCGIDSAELIWFAIALSFLRNSSSRSSEEAEAWTVMRERIASRSATAKPPLW